MAGISSEPLDGKVEPNACLVPAAALTALFPPTLSLLAPLFNRLVLRFLLAEEPSCEARVSHLDSQLKTFPLPLVLPGRAVL